ncbi:MAG: DEAD/DEAH box helicase [bacterium]
MSFESLRLPEFLTDTLARLRFVDATPIQREAIPHILAGSDLVGIAQTGTGKTAAFALPIIAQLNATTGPRRVEVLAVVPTRELALQVAASFRKFAENSPRKLEVLALIGGADIDKQIRSLGHGVDVVVATPGRLIDLVGRSELNLEYLKIRNSG